jgi:hypothetical protein
MYYPRIWPTVCQGNKNVKPVQLMVEQKLQQRICKYKTSDLSLRQRNKNLSVSEYKIVVTLRSADLMKAYIQRSKEISDVIAYVFSLSEI